MSDSVFDRYESIVRSYCRGFPAVFSSAQGSWMTAADGRRYLDFFAGAGALNYGHNPTSVRDALIRYLQRDGILHGLDMHTEAKAQFLEVLQRQILAPRQLDYRVQFCGPTGSNAVEAALKLARKVTGRRCVFAFQGGYHGMSLGSLACTGNRFNRLGAGVSLPDVVFMPYPAGPMAKLDTLAYLRAVLEDPNSGVDLPAAVIVETVQAEGGVYVAPDAWLQGLSDLCHEFDVLLIIDDIQVGCGRTGSFFSFETAAIQPDMVTLSKSISGCGLPMAITLIKPQWDQWSPGEHNGTFRGNQLAFIAGTEALSLYDSLGIPALVAAGAQQIREGLNSMITRSGLPLQLRGRGLIWGVDLSAVAATVNIDTVLSHCFERGLIIENAGRHGQVIKLLPPLTASSAELQQGLEIIEDSLLSVLS